MFLNLNIKNPI